MMAGTLAPVTPKIWRFITGNGTPVTCDGLATRFANTWTMTIPAISAISTCQLAIPRANSDPAVTYPPTLCTSDIQNAKMLYQDQVCLLNGARSTLVRAGS